MTFFYPPKKPYKPPPPPFCIISTPKIENRGFFSDILEGKSLCKNSSPDCSPPTPRCKTGVFFESWYLWKMPLFTPLGGLTEGFFHVFDPPPPPKTVGAFFTFLTPPPLFRVFWRKRRLFDLFWTFLGGKIVKNPCPPPRFYEFFINLFLMDKPKSFFRKTQHFRPLH
jgi:hypothetical protein